MSFAGKWPAHRRGFTLVEVALALGVAAFALVAIFGLLPVGLTSNQNSYEQTAAAAVASSLSADLRAASNSATISPLFGIDLPTVSSGTTPNTVATHLFFKEDGSLSGAKNTNASAAFDPRYHALVVIKSASKNDKSTSVRLFITWPALADSTVTSAQTKFSGSYEAFTFLDRN